MKRVFVFLVCLAVALPCVALPFNVPGNLLVNGDFESGFAGWNGTYGILDSSQLHINPGPVSGTHVGIVDANQNPMTQAVQTIIGQEYDLIMSVRAPDLVNGIPIEGNSSAVPAQLNVELNDRSLKVYSISDRTVWDTISLDFVATSTSSELEFYDRGDDTFIDNVSLVAVPESLPTGFSFGMVCAFIFIFANYPRQRTSAQHR